MNVKGILTIIVKAIFVIILIITQSAEARAEDVTVEQIAIGYERALDAIAGFNIEFHGYDGRIDLINPSIQDMLNVFCVCCQTRIMNEQLIDALKRRREESRVVARGVSRIPFEPRKKNVHVPGHGNVSVRYIPVRMRESDLISQLQRNIPFWSTTVNIGTMFELHANMGYFWCFIEQGFTRMPIQQPPHYLFEGYCEETGVPVIYRGYSEVYFLQAIAQHAVLGFEDYTVSITPSTRPGWWDIRARRGGEVLYDRDYWLRPQHYGFVRIRERNGGLRPYVCVVRGWFHDVNYVTVNIANVSRRLTTQGVTGPSTPGPTNPPIIVDVDQTNILNRLDEILDEIRRTSNDDGEIGVIVPIIDWSDFPGMTREEFEEFQRRLWEELRRLGLLLDPDNWPTVPTIYIPDLPDLPDIGGILGIIEALIGLLTSLVNAISDLLSSIIDLLSDWGSTILDLPATIAELFTDLFIPDIEMPYLPSSVSLEDFDFRINLMDYFPFSLPRDFVDLISVMSGASPAQTLGATTHERFLMDYFEENGYLSAQGMAIIAPLNSGFATPKFEVNIPLPDLAGGSSVEILILDFNNHPTLIAVIRWGVFLIFVLGLIKITPKVLLI